MGAIKDIGRRIELIPMDSQFHEITIGLYRLEGERPSFLVHTYSQIEGVESRLAFLRKAMIELAGLVEEDGLLSFPCCHEHHAAVRRAFLEAAKISDEQVVSRPLTTLDKKSGLTMRVSGLGNGLYEVTTEGEGKSPERRIKVVANGLAKLGEMHLVDGRDDQVEYPCKQVHDALTGLLLVRAPNVRALVREEEMVASRGVLAAPSQQ